MSRSNVAALTEFADCQHCGTRYPTSSSFAPFCCRGCREVYALLHDEGLTRFYELGGGEGAPVQAAGNDHHFVWLEPLLAKLPAGPIARLELDIQGLHCAACVWLINELFKRQRGGLECTVNPALGRVRLAWRRDEFDLLGFLSAVERFGYRFGPARKTVSTSRDLPLRMGICAAIAMNVMIFTMSFYTGLAPEDGLPFTVFTRLNIALSTVVVVVGGWPFFKSAWAALRRGVLHLDLPIAAGILLAFGTSFVASLDGRGDLAYFDTLNIFVTLMLVGRWLQRRMLERNRRFLLEDAGADGLLVRVHVGDRLEVVPATRVRAGDELLLAPGELVPVDAELLDEHAQVSTDWITGESTPLDVMRSGTVPAGSFNKSRRALRVRARQPFADSTLPALLRANANDATRPRYELLTERISRYYVPAVLAIAALGFLMWRSEGVPTALGVTVALLVVTCPCALGLALPLASEMALAHLRRSGVYVRANDLLDRLTHVRSVLFDKTGTLTLGGLELANPDAIEALDEEARQTLYDLVSRSNHPVSRCVAHALGSEGQRFAAEVDVTEEAGMGMELMRAGRRWRFGRPSWAAPGEEAAGTVLSVDGRVVASLQVREALRQDAREVIESLRQDGLDVWLVSGDTPEKVAAAARELGVDENRTLAAQRPEEKAQAVRRIDAERALFIGDGVNDSLAFAASFANGTPVVDRPVMPARSDFFLLGEGVSGVRALVRTAHALRSTSHRVMVFAFTYNALAIAVSLAGWMTPLRAAVAMPVSTLLILSLVARRMSRRQLDSEAHS